MGKGREEGLCLDSGFRGGIASLLHPLAPVFGGFRGDLRKSFSVDQKLHAFKKMATIAYYRMQQLSRGF